MISCALSALASFISFRTSILQNYFLTKSYIAGQCAAPRIGWQIDPFGHARENAKLFNMLGFDGLFFARNDYREKNQMKTNKNLHQIWHTDNGRIFGYGNYLINHVITGNVHDLLTGVLIHHYEPPSGFCYDLLCQDEPIMDNPELKGYNVDRLVI